MHNSVYHSYLNEEIMGSTKECGSWKMWIPFHGWLDVLQMCKWRKEQWMHKTVFFHLSPRAINDMLKHWKHTQTCNCTDSVTVKHETDICDLFFFVCKPDIQNPVKLLLWRSHWTSSHIHYLQMTQRLEEKMGFFQCRWDLVVSLGKRANVLLTNLLPS